MSFLDKLEEKFLKMQFSGRDRLRLYRKLARFLSNGVPLPEALNMMWSHASLDGRKPKTVQAVVIDSWRKSVSGGKTFGVAIQDWVPASDRIVIEAGERAGNLADSLENACVLNEGQSQIRGAVIGGIAYPIVLVMMVIGFMVMFGLQVIPSFEEIMPRERWTGVGAQMAIMSDFVRTGLVPTLAAFLGMIFVILWSMPRWTGPIRAKLDNYPPYSIYRLISGSGFLLSVAALVKAGVKVTNVLSTLQRNAPPWYNERLGKTLAIVQNGADIGDALYRTKLEFPDRETVNDLRSYAKLNGFDEMLLILGRQNLDDSIKKIKAQTTIIRNAGIVLLGIVFMWIATGIFDLLQQVQSGL